MEKNENRQYLEREREELRQIYAGEIMNDYDEQKSLYDYISEALDFEYVIDSRKDYVSSKIWITLGGPNVWIDTREKALKLAWWNEREELYLDSEICDEIDYIMEEYYNM